MIQTSSNMSSSAHNFQVLRVPKTVKLMIRKTLSPINIVQARASVFNSSRQAAPHLLLIYLLVSQLLILLYSNDYVAFRHSFAP